MLLLAEIEANGFENVTMAQLAAVVGASPRTLHRYFPAKSDIVWGGIDTSIDALREGLASLPPHAGVVESVIAVVRDVLERNAEEVAVMRARLRLIAGSAELQRRRVETYEGWRGELTALVAARTGRAPGELAVVAAGAALQTAVTIALTEWAAHDEETDPGDWIEAALRGLRLLA